VKNLKLCFKMAFLCPVCKQRLTSSSIASVSQCSFPVSCQTYAGCVSLHPPNHQTSESFSSSPLGQPLAAALYTWQLTNVPVFTSLLNNIERYNHISYISSHIVLLCNYKILPATVKLWKHSWKLFYESLFSSSIAFLIISVASQNRLPFNADFSRKNL
jgi:hypothetical protein